MIGHMGWIQCAQNISGCSRMSESSMSDPQILATLYGGLVELICVVENYAATQMAVSFANSHP
jgi:hypothetical protein